MNSAVSDDDVRWMREALCVASNSIGLSSPNPRVGCVIVAPNGREIGRGFTQQVGQAHAEVRAIQDARSRGEDINGATAYVTLEPCSHHGRTPPCCDALISSGIARVVSAVEDPNSEVQGAGHSRLLAAGIDVKVGVCEEESRDLNIGFFWRMLHGRPWVRLKSAASLDGRTGLRNGVSQWITSQEARIDGHRWRKRADVIVTGVGTILKDDPSLDVRYVSTPTQPVRVILDSELRSPLKSKVFRDPSRVNIYTTCKDESRIGEFLAEGILVTTLLGKNGKVDLRLMLRHLADSGVNEVHLEAGAVLSGAFVTEQLVDEYLMYLAPTLIGDGLPIASIGQHETLHQATRLILHRVDRVGEDLRVVARPS
jgi:diaminohydroxyphosphoribosylaminopyrimidine deaminase/5-amino-6-(5-phosphoribosylamino)uracil reductase